MEELQVAYSVKEIVERVAHKIDRLDEKFDAFAGSMENRVTVLETAQVSAEKVEALETKAKRSLYGLGVALFGVAVDTVLRLLHK